MQNQKSAIKWFAVIMVVTLIVFGVALDYGIKNGVFTPKNSEKNQTASGNLQEDGKSEDVGDDKQNETDLIPKIEFSKFPRIGEKFENFTVQHTGGKKCDSLIETIFYDELTFAFVKSESCSNDFKANGKIALACFDDESLRMTYVFDEESFLSAKTTSSGIVVLTANEEISKISLLSYGLLAMKTEKLPKYDSGKFFLDSKNKELMLFATTNSKLDVYSINMIDFEISKIFETNLLDSKVVEVLKLNDKFILVCEKLLGFEVLEFSKSNKMISKCYESENVFLQVIPFYENSSFKFVFVETDKNDLFVKKLDGEFQPEQKYVQSGCKSGKIAYFSDYFILFSEQKIQMLCKHLDANYSTEWTENIDTIDLFAQGKDSVKIVARNKAKHQTFCFEMVSFKINLLFKVQTENTPVSFFDSGEKWKMLFSSANNQEMMRENFGEIDTFFICV